MATTTIEERRKDYFGYNFYYPLELFFYKALRDKYPEMTVADIVVCRDVFIRLTSIDEDCEFHDVVDRMQIWTLDTISREDWARYVFENKDRILEENEKDKCNSLQWAEEKIQKIIDKHGLDHAGGYPLFQNKSRICEAIGLACGHGYISYDLYKTDHNEHYWNPQLSQIAVIVLPNAHVTLRKDIFNTLADAVDDTVQTTQYVTDKELFRHEQEQAEFDRRHTERLS
jgi:hypothetical protein